MDNIFQIWINWEEDKIGVGSEEECSILQSGSFNIEIWDTYNDLESAKNNAERIANEKCLEYTLT